MVDPRSKHFSLQAREIKPLATGYGGCFATDMITVGGRKMAFMYRQDPDNDVDSGWRFMSGYESPEYMDDPDNLAIYDVNTIANYDQDIIPFLDSPVGSASNAKMAKVRLLRFMTFSPQQIRNGAQIRIATLRLQKAQNISIFRKIVANPIATKSYADLG